MDIAFERCLLPGDLWYNDAGYSVMDRRRVKGFLRRHVCAGFSEEETERFLALVSPVDMPFSRGQIVKETGDELMDIILVTQGTLYARATDSRGASMIIQVYGEGDLAMLEVSLSARRTVPDRLVGGSDGRLLLFHTEEMRSIKEEIARRLIKNMEAWLASDMIRQRNRMSVLMQRTTRERVLRYFDILRERQGDVVDVKMTLNDMAEYLCVSRASITDVMPRLREEGLIDYAYDPKTRRGEKSLVFRLLYRKDEWE